jgi:hypothetical protein
VSQKKGTVQQSLRGVPGQEALRQADPPGCRDNALRRGDALRRHGIRHLAAACGGNLYCLSGAIPLTLIRCVRVRDIQVIVEEQKPVSMVTLKMLIDGAKKALGMS